MSVRSLFLRFSKFATMRILLPFSYFIHSRGKKIDQKKIVFVEKRFDHMSDNFALIERALKEEGDWNIRLHCLCQGRVSLFRFLKNCLEMSRDIGDAGCVLLNEGIAAYGCLNIRKETITIQTWHGCGAFKKFGISLSDKNVGGSEDDYINYPIYGNNDYITVSSPEVVWAYEEAMSITENDSRRVVPVGTSRTDVYFDENIIKAGRTELEQLVPQAKNKKVILYAPTFRGQPSGGHIPDRLDIEQLRRSISDEYILVIKHHPLGLDRQVIPESCADFAFDITTAASIETALMAADVCITDYSSLVFEYSLLERPLIFFAYDIDDYLDERGFYYPFEEFCPGPIVKTTAELAEAVNACEKADLSAVRAFRDKFMSACDGHATERVVEIIKHGKRNL